MENRYSQISRRSHFEYFESASFHPYPRQCLRCERVLVVQVLVIVVSSRSRLETSSRRGSCGASAANASFRELEVVAESARLLQCLREHFVLPDVGVVHRTAGKLHGLLEVNLGDFWYRVNRVLSVHRRILACLLALLLELDFALNALTDGHLGSTLANLGEVGARVTRSVLRQVDEVDIWRERRLAKGRLKDVHARALIWQRYVDELVETPRPQHGGVNDIRAVGRANDEDRLLGPHAIHLGKNLVDHAVACSARVARGRAARARNRVKLIEEKHTRSRAASFLEELANIRLRLAEPHGEKLWALNGDEVGGALVGDGLGKQRLAAAWRAVKEDALRRAHAELLELVGVVDRVLHNLLELALDALEAADVLPGDVGHLDDRLAQRRRVGRAERGAEVSLVHSH
mmetsp:Transcript_23619/g.50895  ORF Transcript_23619/g.50895 Transcript_23619/m.50895 type:complete len:404 (-) Transcript_23619:1377-2588(-)